MRTMMRACFDVAITNQKISDGSLQKLVQKMIKELKPEASYFYSEKGKRAAILIFDMSEPSQIPQVAEPLFMEFGAEVEFIPVMNASDLEKGLKNVMSASRAAA